MATRIFKPKVPKNQDASIFTDADGSRRVDVRLRRSSGELFRKQARSIPSKAAARKIRDSFFEEFNILEGGEAYSRQLIVVEEPVTDGVSVRVWCQECVDKHWPRRVPSTLKDYKQLIAHHVVPDLGGLQLTQLSAKVIQDWLFKLATKDVVTNSRVDPPTTIKLSVSSLKAAKGALSSALSIAVEEGHIASNPAIGMKIRWKVLEQDRRRSRQLRDDEEDCPDKRLLSVEEVNVLLSKSSGSRIYPTLLLQCKCGLRIAEALAIRTSDFDLSAGIVRIRKQLKWVESDGKRRLIRDDLKTRTSMRDIPLPESVRQFIAPLAGTDTPLTKNEDGGFLDPRKAQELVRRALVSAGLCDRQGQPNPTSHSLRYYWTSRLLNDLKVPITDVIPF